MIGTILLVALAAPGDAAGPAGGGRRGGGRAGRGPPGRGGRAGDAPVGVRERRPADDAARRRRLAAARRPPPGPPRAVDDRPDRRRDGTRVVALLDGEVRATSAGGLTVVGPSATARLGRGIARARIEAGGLRVGAEDGEVAVAAGSEPPRRRPPRVGEVVVDGDGRLAGPAGDRAGGLGDPARTSCWPPPPARRAASTSGAWPPARSRAARSPAPAGRGPDRPEATAAGPEPPPPSTTPGAGGVGGRRR